MSHGLARTEHPLTIKRPPSLRRGLPGRVRWSTRWWARGYLDKPGRHATRPGDPETLSWGCHATAVGIPLNFVGTVATRETPKPPSQKPKARTPRSRTPKPESLNPRPCKGAWLERRPKTSSASSSFLGGGFRVQGSCHLPCRGV